MWGFGIMKMTLPNTKYPIYSDDTENPSKLCVRDDIQTKWIVFETTKFIGFLCFLVFDQLYIAATYIAE